MSDGRLHELVWKEEVRLLAWSKGLRSRASSSLFKTTIKSYSFEEYKGTIKSLAEKTALRATSNMILLLTVLTFIFVLFFCFRGIKGCYAVCRSSVWQRLGSGQGQGTVAAI